MKTKRRSAGFTLTEVAAVMAVVAMIIGGVWVVAGNVNSMAKQDKFTNLVRTAVENIRGAYAGRPTFDTPAATVGTMMPLLMNMNVFPSDSIHQSGGVWVVNSPFGAFTNPNNAGSPYKSLYACAWGSSGSTRCAWNNGPLNAPLFAIEVLLSKNDCIRATLRNADPAVIPGFVALYINQHLQTAPMTLVAANDTATGCNAAVNTVDFIYRLKP